MEKVDWSEQSGEETIESGKYREGGEIREWGGKSRE